MAIADVKGSGGRIKTTPLATRQTSQQQPPPRLKSNSASKYNDWFWIHAIDGPLIVLCAGSY